jgi:hypothetical protein
MKTISPRPTKALAVPLILVSMLMAACGDQELELDDEQAFEELEVAMLDFDVVDLESTSENAPELPVLHPDEEEEPVEGDFIYLHNTIYTSVFDPLGPDYCKVHFFFGNYPTGYAYIKFDAHPGCNGVTSYVVTHNGNYHVDADASWTPGVWAQAAPGVGNILQATYCIESHYWGNRILVFNALTRRLEGYYTNPGDTCVDAPA